MWLYSPIKCVRNVLKITCKHEWVRINVCTPINTECLLIRQPFARIISVSV